MYYHQEVYYFALVLTKPQKTMVAAHTNSYIIQEMADTVSITQYREAACPYKVKVGEKCLVNTPGV